MAHRMVNGVAVEMTPKEEAEEIEETKLRVAAMDAARAARDAARGPDPIARLDALETEVAALKAARALSR